MSRPSPSPETAPRFLPEYVLLDVAAADPKTALWIAARALAAAHAHDVTLVGDALWRREQAASTALGHCFAVPHARVAGLDGPRMLYLRSRLPIPFGAADGRLMSHLLVILVPVGGDHDDHLRLLAQVAGLVVDRRFRARLATATDRRDVMVAFEADVVGGVVFERATD